MPRLSTARALKFLGLVLSPAMLLAACGGGSDTAATSPASPSSVGALAAPAIDIQPSFHRLPDPMPEPADIDADGSGSSAFAAPVPFDLPADYAGLSTARLTDAKVAAFRAAGSPQERVFAAAPAQAVTMTPAQVRAAYGFPALPVSLAGLPAATAATLGAGQTIYLIDAQDNPNTIADLASFNAKYGLPGCSTLSIASTTRLPLAAASPTAGCSIAVVHVGNGAVIGNAAPAYDASWSTEIALDVQWAHVAAPMARIVLIEAQNSSSSALMNAIQLANSMGPGVVSMSWGGSEFSGAPNYDAMLFGTRGMSYFASAGDAGAQVNWPAVSAAVVGVGGTTLYYSGSGSRAESVWTSSGGGVSVYTPQPGFQSTLVPTVTSANVRASAAARYRAVSDVSYNADPASGVLIAVTPKGAAKVSWYEVGGTSAGAPQWAAIAAIANATRLAAGKPVLGTGLLTDLYTRLASNATGYAGNFLDVVTGSDGSCTLCKARAGYDVGSGLGTPRVSALLGALQAL